MPARKSAKSKQAKRKSRIVERRHAVAAVRTPKASSKPRILSELRKGIVSQDDDASEVERTEAAMGKKLNRFTAPGVEVVDELKKRWKAQEKGVEVKESETETKEGMGIDKEEEEEEEPFQLADPEEEKDEEDEDGDGF